MSDHDVMFCHDDETIFYPAGDGRVFAIRFAALSDACDLDLADDAFATMTKRTDLAGMLRISTGGPRSLPRPLLPLDLCRPCPKVWTDLGNFDDDLSDAVDAWADFCDRLVAAEDGEVAVLAAVSRAA
jgi:hypothetical protein